MYKKDEVRPLHEICKILFPEWKEVVEKLCIPDIVFEKPHAFYGKDEEFLRTIENATGEVIICCNNILFSGYSQEYETHIINLLEEKMKRSKDFRLIVVCGGKTGGYSYHNNRGSLALRSEFVDRMKIWYKMSYNFNIAILKTRPECQFYLSSSEDKLVLYAPFREYENLRVTYTWNEKGLYYKLLYELPKLPNKHDIHDVLINLETNSLKAWVGAWIGSVDNSDNLNNLNSLDIQRWSDMIAAPSLYNS